MGCHAPHMWEEWWVAGPSRRAADLQGWRRPWRTTRAAPHDASLMASPVTFGDAHVWVDDGGVYTLPLYRLAGLYAPANAAVVTAAFAVPAAPLFLNADARWRGRVAATGNRTCDEGCAAYVMAELLFDNGTVVPGFDRAACILVDVDDLRVPLVWQGGADLGSLAGMSARLRFLFRDATLYGIWTG